MLQWMFSTNNCTLHKLYAVCLEGKNGTKRAIFVSFGYTSTCEKETFDT